MESKIGGSFKKVAGLAAAAFAAAGVGAFFKGTISLASDAEQSIGGVEAVFKDYSNTVISRSKAADRALGLSGNSYRELSTLIGAQLKNAGVPMDQLSGKTDSLISTGADLAAMFGGTTSDAVAALSSALKGEMDPIEKYGISLNDSALKAEAASLGLKVMGGTLTNSQKSMAVMSLVTKQSGDALGAFSRESDTAAGRQQRATAQWENLKTTIGDHLLPVWSGLMDFVGTKVIPGLETVSGVAGQVFDVLFKGDFTGGPLSEDSPVVGTLFRIRDGIQGVYDLVVNGDFTGKLAHAFDIQEDNPVVGFVLDARDALLHAWDNLTGLWDGLDISGLGTRVKDAAIQAGGDLLSGIKTGLDTGNWAPLGQSIVGIIGDALSTIGTLASKVYGAFKDLMSKVDWVGVGLELGKQVPTLLAGLALGILNFDPLPLLIGLKDHWFEVVMGLLALAFTPVKVIGKVGEILARVPLVGKFLEWMLNAVKGLVDKIAGWVGDIIGGFVKAFLGEGTKIGGAFKSIFDHVSTTLYVWWDDLLGWFKGIPGKVVEVAEALGSELRRKVDEIAAWVGAIFKGIWDDAVVKMTGLKDSVVGIFQTARDWIVDRIWTPFRDTLASIAQTAWDWVVARFTGLKDGAVGIFTTARDFIVDRVWTPFRDTLVNIAQNIWDWVVQRFTGLKDRAVSIFQEAKDRVVGFFTGLRDTVVSIAQNVWDWVVDKFTRMKDGVVGIFNGIKDTVGNVWNELQEKVKAPIRITFDWVNGHMIDPVNTILSKFPGNLSIPHLPALREGGLLRGPGTGTSDSILGVDANGIPTSRVSNGEFVVNARATKKNFGLLHAINSGLPGFADGGPLGWLGSAASAVGHGVSNAAGWVKDAAGNAWDFASEMVKKGARKAAEWILNPLRDAAKALIPNAVPLNMLSGGIDKLVDAVLGKGDEADKALSAAGDATPFMGMAAGGVQRWAGTVSQALAMLGQPQSLIQTVLRRMNQESGGNPTAINLWDSNAKKGIPSKGLMQVIDPTFRSNALPGYSSNIYDPLSNILASMRYAIGRYGSLSAAYNKAGGYANGTSLASPGLHLVGENGPELVGFKGGESVLNARRTKAALVSASSAPLVNELHVHVGDGGTVKEGIEETMFQLRRIRRGGGSR